MRPTPGLRHAAIALLASTMLGTTGTAFAQDAPPADEPAAENSAAADASATEDTDIIVTAAKREENLQDVPISIQALGTQRLEELNVANFNDYTKLTPSVSFQTSQPGVTNVYIRGVASGG